MQGLIDAIVLPDPKVLLFNINFGAISFGEIEGEVTELYKMLKLLRSLPLTHIPTMQVFNELKNQLESTQDSLDQIKNFRPGEDKRTKQDFIPSAKESMASLSFVLSKVVPYLVILEKWQATPIDDYERALENKVKAADESIIKIVTEQNAVIEQLTTANALIKAAQDMLSENTVGSFENLYSAKAKELNDSSRWWLGATAVFTLFILGIVWYYFIEHPTIENNIIQGTISRIVIVAVLLTAAAWCGKNYRSIKHLENIYDFKSNALGTFKAFRDSADDEVIKDAILRETTKAIFEQAPTGYLDGSKEHQGNEVNLISAVQKAVKPDAGL